MDQHAPFMYKMLNKFSHSVEFHSIGTFILQDYKIIFANPALLEDGEIGLQLILLMVFGIV